MKKLITTTLFISLLVLFSNNCYSQESQDYTYYYNLGYAKLVDGSFEKAIEIFNHTLELKPDCSEAYLGLGIAHRQLNQLEKALEATNKALETDPEYFKAYYNLGLIYEQIGNKQEALNAFKTFYKRVPEAKNIPDLKIRMKRLKD
ncbi:MAG: tetratricopeptide repeat protein [Cyanobacteriota bacterium]